MNATGNKQISVGTRLGTMLLDHFIMTMVAMVFFIPGMVSGFAGAFEISHEQARATFMGQTFSYIGILGIAAYLCKDCINGRSVAKRIIKLQVVDNSTGQAANPLKCLVRNLFVIIWPVEVIAALINPGRRLGDKVAGTKLVVFDPVIEQPKLNIGQFLISFAAAYILALLVMLPLKEKIAAIEGAQIHYVESCFNQRSSKELEQMFADKLGQYLTPNVRVYDKIQNEDLKYISIILKLKENYLENEKTYEQLHSMTTSLIYSKYPKETFAGQLKYFFSATGQMQSQSMRIGTDIEPKQER